MTVETNDLFKSADESTTNDNGGETVNLEELSKLEPTVLAKRLNDSQEFISRLKREQAELRGQLNERLTIEQFIDKLQNNQSQGQGNGTTNADQSSNNGSDSSAQFSKDDVAKLVNSLLGEERQKMTKQQNVAYINDTLTKEWGANYQAKLQEIAKDVGGPEFLGSLAETNPRAFLKLVGVNQTQAQPRVTSDGTPPRNQVLSTGQAKVHKTYKDFKELQRTNPRKYFSPEIQNEMYRLLSELGPEKFYS